MKEMCIRDSVEGALKYWKKALEMGSESKTLKQKIEKKKMCIRDRDCSR